MERIAASPGSVLGSSRKAFDDGELRVMLESLHARGIRYIFYTGGNGSMETALRMTRSAQELGFDLRVIGVPKTIDNDIAGTDHTPGYPSCARFVALAMRDIGEDNRALPTPVNVVEVIGRNVGWVVGASALARRDEDDPPHLVYLPERRLPEDQLLGDVDRVCRRLGRVVIAICEGQRNENGEPFGADSQDAHDPKKALASNLGHTLARLIAAKLGLRSRAERPGLLGRSSSLCVAPFDRDEARGCGAAAVRAAVAGHTGQMIALRRAPGEVYRCSFALIPLEKIAGIERAVPPEWIASGGSGVTPVFFDYVRPLVGDIPPMPRL
jgi:6-phosphofructokinase 1